MENAPPIIKNKGDIKMIRRQGTSTSYIMKFLIVINKKMRIIGKNGIASPINVFFLSILITLRTKNSFTVQGFLEPRK
jgi:hypothetical protein